MWLGGENSEKSSIKTRCNNDCESSIDDWKLKGKLSQTHARKADKEKRFSVVVKLSQPPSPQPPPPQILIHKERKKKSSPNILWPRKKKNLNLIISFTISHVILSFFELVLFLKSQIIAKHFSLACTENKIASLDSCTPC